MQTYSACIDKRSGDSDTITPNNASFHKGLRCLLRQKRPSEKEQNLNKLTRHCICSGINRF